MNTKQVLMPVNNDSTSLWTTVIIFLSTSVIYTCNCATAAAAKYDTTAFAPAAKYDTTATTAANNNDTGCTSKSKTSFPGIFAASSTSISSQEKEKDDENDDNNNGMPTIPPDVVKYSQVPKQGKQFTSTTLPKGLLKEHTTKDGTWGIIRVSQGLLEYKIPFSSTENDDDDDDADSHHHRHRVFRLSKDLHGIIAPQRLHQVKPLSADVQFVVEFYRLPGTGPVVEERELKYSGRSQVTA